ncbi:MAG: flagellar protein FliT [Gammaproteobacteria bacterium]|nr:flagellar protein FliT [Gammaproteobacteria bacterium]
MNAIIDMSQEMLALAESEDWSAVSDIELKRHTLIEHYFSTTTSHCDKQNVIRFIQQVLQIDKQIAQLGAVYRNKQRGKLQTLNKSRKAVNLYIASQSDH